MTRKSIALVRDYQLALRHFLARGSGTSLKPAQRLGRRAVALRLETLDVALIHENALIAQVLSVNPSAVRDRIIKRARAFFAEAIVPLEETHRSALETNADLKRLNGELSQRTRNLTTSSRLLKKQIARRQVVEDALRKSEEHTRRLLTESRNLQDQLRRLSRRILSAQEDERKRISRELHDVVAQTLTGINVRLTALKTAATANTKGIGIKISRAQRLVEKSVAIVHRFARELRPAALDDLGLIPALLAFAKGFLNETGIRVTLSAFAGVEALSSAKRTVLYRVVQEALTNVARHAHASQVDVSIQKLSNAVAMQVRDNGQSFQVAKVKRASTGQHLGLLGMRERVEMVGGEFGVESAPGGGTIIHAQIPFHSIERGSVRA